VETHLLEDLAILDDLALELLFFTPVSGDLGLDFVGWWQALSCQLGPGIPVSIIVGSDHTIGGVSSQQPDTPDLQRGLFGTDD
jgi:hypothetical protein